MNDRELYQQILALAHPWKVTDNRLSLADRQVVVVAGYKTGLQFPCPNCGVRCGVYDHRKRHWRHLDTCQLQTLIEAEVPRVNCPEHGVQQVAVSWAEPGGRFTALFEAMVIAWFGEAPISAVAGLVGLTWDQVDGIQQRAIERGLTRREPKVVAHMGIDETSYQKHHEYVSVITDRNRCVVLEVLEDRKKETVLSWLDTLDESQKPAVQTVSMDMWEPFINAFLEGIPGASSNPRNWAGCGRNSNKRSRPLWSLPPQPDHTEDCLESPAFPGPARRRLVYLQRQNGPFLSSRNR